jgi:N-acetylmuramoyl-L-alanine amidase
MLSDKASNKAAARLAEAENRVDILSGVDLSAEPDDIAGILILLAQRETMAFSRQFRKLVVGSLKGAVRLRGHPLEAAGFRVLKAPDVPAVLIELGYMSNPDDLNNLLSQHWRMRATDAIVEAVNSYFVTRLVDTSH